MLKKQSSYVIAILGATGAVGHETLDILDERKFPIAGLRLFASKRSAGEVLTCQGKEWTVEELTPDVSFAGVDIALISATDAISREYGSRLGAAGVMVIDDSAVFRMDRDVPLVVPEVNAQALGSMPRGIVAIPNCTTTPLVMALKPLRDAVGLKRVVVTTFQSVSGTGAAAMEELVTQTKDLMAFRDVKTEVYPYQIAFNLLPHIGSFSEEGDCSEEVKIANETRKILDVPTLRVTATTVRVPVLRCHSEVPDHGLLDVGRKPGVGLWTAGYVGALGVPRLRDRQRRYHRDERLDLSRVDRLCCIASEVQGLEDARRGAGLSRQHHHDRESGFCLGSCLVLGRHPDEDLLGCPGDLAADGQNADPALAAIRWD